MKVNLSSSDKRVLIVLLGVMLCLNAALFLGNWKAVAAGRNDFPIFYSNAQAVHEGKASALFDFDSENVFARRVTNIPRPPFNHGPYELLLFIPFTHLKFMTAYAVWSVLSLAMFAGVAAIIQSLYRTGWSFALSLLVILAFYPVWYSLIDGQDGALLLLLFSISFWLWKRGKDDAAGFVLALGLFRPPLVLPFVFIALLAGKWKFIRGFVPGAALAAALSVGTVGLHGMVDYVRILISQATEKSASVLADRWLVRPGGQMTTWRGFLSLCLPAWAPTWSRTLLLLSGTALGLGWAAKKMREVKSPDAAFAIATATVLLVSFHSALNDFSLMILPVLIFQRVLAHKITVSIAALGFLLFCTPLYLVLFTTANLGWLFAVQAIPLWLLGRTEASSKTVLVPAPEAVAD